MPGNATIYKSPRTFFPATWSLSNIAPNANVVAGISGLLPGFTDLPFPRSSSVASLIVALSQPITAQSITLTMRRNGVDTTLQAQIVPSDGIVAIKTVPLNAAVYLAGETIGFSVSTPVGLTPAGQIDLVIYFEAQNV